MEQMTAFDKFRFTMEQKDDTSKFVGLFLLLQILGDDPVAAKQYWDCIEPKFLDKLILSRQTKSCSEQEAVDLQRLGCSILHAFASYSTVHGTARYLRRSTSLLKLYCRGPIHDAETRTRLAQILTTISSHAEGSIAIMSNDLYEHFARKIMSESWDEGYLVLQSTLLNLVSAGKSVSDIFQHKIRDTFTAAAAGLQENRKKYNQCIAFLQNITSAMDEEHLTFLLTDDALDSIRVAIKNELSKPVKGEEYGNTLILLSTLLQLRFFLLICSLASAEVRSSVAGLVDQTHQSISGNDSLRVARAYDIMRIFCTYLITSEKISIAPDDILKIRDDLSAAYTETIFYLRERWDNAFLDPVLASHVDRPKHQGDPNRPLALDQTIVSGTQSLSLWLEEDESLHQDGRGIIDVMMGLTKEGIPAGLDYGSWTLPAVEAMLDSEAGKNYFKECGGWEVVTQRLDKIQALLAEEHPKAEIRMHLRNAMVATAILEIASPSDAEKWKRSHKKLVDRIEATLP